MALAVLAGREKDFEQFVDAGRAFKHGLRVVVLVQIDHGMFD